LLRFAEKAELVSVLVESHIILEMKMDTGGGCTLNSKQEVPSKQINLKISTIELPLSIITGEKVDIIIVLWVSVRF
jgi:hypothetical protein